MFDFLRRMIVPIMMIALIGFLATIIFQWGADINSRSQFDSVNTAAMINGEEVTWTEFNNVYSNLAMQESRNYEEDLSDTRKEQLQSQAWQQILSDRLLYQQAEKNKITVTDDELYQYMKAIPPVEIQQASVFQTNGQFDYQKYISALADPGFASVWAQFDPIMRRQIKIAKLQNDVVLAAHITEDEVKNQFLSSSETVKVGYIKIDKARYANPAPTPSEEQLRSYYENHLDEYKRGEQAVLKLALIDKSPTQEDWDLVEARTRELYDSLQNGSDFAQLAQIFSEDGSAQNGGDLGWFDENQMVKPFNDKVFSMKKDEVSEPVRTQFGWHLIKLHDTRTQDGKKQAHASHILLKVRTSQETLDNYYSTLDELILSAGEKGFDQAAEDLGIEVKTTQPFEDKRNIQYIGFDPVASKFAFNNEVNAISNVMTNQSSIFVAQLAEKIPAGQLTFEEAKMRIEPKVLDQIIMDISKDTAQAIYDEIASGKSFNQAAKNHNWEYKESTSFTRNEFVQGIGNEPQVIGGAFSLTQPDSYTKPIEFRSGYVIMKLLDRTSPDLTEFTAKKDSISQELLTKKQQDIYRAWYQNLVQSSDIQEDIFETLRENRDNI